MRPRRAARHQGPAHAAPKKRSAKRTAAWMTGTLLLVLVLLAGAAAGYGWYLNHEIHRIDLRNLTSAPVKGADAGTENILMIGSTDRCALKVQNPAYGLCSQGVNGVNSDVVMILHLNPTTHSLSILSIPRDLFVPNARYDGANKIDAGLYQGPDQLIKAIEEDFGIPIQHFVELNFDSFINVVTRWAGSRCTSPSRSSTPTRASTSRRPAASRSTASQALQVVRARHLQYKGSGVTTTDPNYWPHENQSDLARIRRDHEFLRVLAAAVKAKGLGNPITDEQLVSGVVGQLTVDSGFSASDMISLVLGFHNVNVNAAPQLTLPVVVDQFGSYIYQGGNYGDIEFPVQPQDHTTDRPVPRAHLEQRRHLLGGQAPRPLDGDGLGAQRLGRHQPGHRHRQQPAGARVQHRDHRRHRVRRPGGRDRRLLRGEDPGTAGGGPGRRQLHVGRGDHGPGPHPGEAGFAGHRRHGHRTSASTRRRPPRPRPPSAVRRPPRSRPPRRRRPRPRRRRATAPSPPRRRRWSPSSPGTRARARRAGAQGACTAQAKISPPFVSSACPVMARDRSEARYTMAPATSSSLGMRPNGTRALSSSTTTWAGTPRPVDVISM